jgi:hypothetical protein
LAIGSERSRFASRTNQSWRSTHDHSIRRNLAQDRVDCHCAVGHTARLSDLAFWPLDGKPTITAPEARLYAAIAGGVTIGLAAFVWMVAGRVYVRDPAAARAIILTSLSAWCVTDSLGSITAGAPMNVLLNLLIWAAFVWPIRPTAAKVA